jgi:site-specific DNA-methyltransferase (adenine-specific)
MGGEPVATVITDPPYGMSFKSNHRKTPHKDIINDGDASCLSWTCDFPASFAKYIWCRWDNLSSVPKPKSLITWVKNNWSMGDLEHEHGRQTEVCLFYPGKDHVWPIKRPSDVVNHARTGNALHPTQKPVSLIEEVCSWTSGSVYDPFLGSGSTLIACEKMSRYCRGLELDPIYVDVIINRWQDFTGSKATLESTGQTYDELKGERLASD